MDENDPDIAAYLAANKRARRSNFVGALRILAAGAVAAAAGLAIFAGVVALLAEDPEAMYRTRYGYRAGEMTAGLIFVASALAGAGGLVSFLVTYKVVGGKVDRETWKVVGGLLLSPFRR
ncbi:MAG: hypothetical protein ACI9KE_003066 [Polyangiales bacterium]